MATIDLKLKSYDELIFEITRLNTDKYLLEQKVERLNNIINELEKELEQEIAVVGANRTVDNNNPEWWYKFNCYNNILDKLKELKEEDKNE